MSSSGGNSGETSNGRAADRRDAGDADALRAAEELERVPGSLHDGAGGEPVGVEPRLEPQRPQGAATSASAPRRAAGAPRRPARAARPLVIVEGHGAERREWRVQEPEVIVAYDCEARARDRLAGRGVDDLGERELALERLAVGPEPDRDTQGGELAGGDLVQRSRGIFPMMVCSPSPIRCRRPLLGGGGYLRIARV